MICAMTTTRHTIEAAGEILSFSCLDGRMCHCQTPVAADKKLRHIEISSDHYYALQLSETVPLNDMFSQQFPRPAVSLFYPLRAEGAC